MVFIVHQNPVFIDFGLELHWHTPIVVARTFLWHQEGAQRQQPKQRSPQGG